jgi:hypothetical protein
MSHFAKGPKKLFGRTENEVMFHKFPYLVSKKWVSFIVVRKKARALQLGVCSDDYVVPRSKRILDPHVLEDEVSNCPQAPPIAAINTKALTVLSQMVSAGVLAYHGSNRPALGATPDDAMTVQAGPASLAAGDGSSCLRESRTALLGGTGTSDVMSATVSSTPMRARTHAHTTHHHHYTPPPLPSSLPQHTTTTTPTPSHIAHHHHHRSPHITSTHRTPPPLPSSLPQHTTTTTPPPLPSSLPQHTTTTTPPPPHTTTTTADHHTSPPPPHHHHRTTTTTHHTHHTPPPPPPPPPPRNAPHLAHLYDTPPLRRDSRHRTVHYAT